MPLEDYAHWNEEAEQVWWQEEGKHADSDHEDDDLIERNEAADCFMEELYENNETELRAMLENGEYVRRWPKARAIILTVMRDRGFKIT